MRRARGGCRIARSSRLGSLELPFSMKRSVFSGCPLRSPVQPPRAGAAPGVPTSRPHTTSFTALRRASWTVAAEHHVEHHRHVAFDSSPRGPGRPAHLADTWCLRPADLCSRVIKTGAAKRTELTPTCRVATRRPTSRMVPWSSNDTRIFDCLSAGLEGGPALGSRQGRYQLPGFRRPHRSHDLVRLQTWG